LHWYLYAGGLGRVWLEPWRKRAGGVLVHALPHTFINQSKAMMQSWLNDMHVHHSTALHGIGHDAWQHELHFRRLLSRMQHCHAQICCDPRNPDQAIMYHEALVAMKQRHSDVMSAVTGCEPIPATRRLGEYNPCNSDQAHGWRPQVPQTTGGFRLSLDRHAMENCDREASRAQLQQAISTMQPESEQVAANAVNCNPHLRSDRNRAAPSQAYTFATPAACPATERKTNGLLANSEGTSLMSTDGAFLPVSTDSCAIQCNLDSPKACVPPKQVGINILEDGAWLAEDLMIGSERGRASSERPRVVLHLADLWGPLWAELPEPQFGCGQHTQYFGLIFGQTDNEGMVRLQKTALCPESFVWEVPAVVTQRSEARLSHVSGISELTNHLCCSLSEFLDAVFLPWAFDRGVSKDDVPVAWLVCNDGESFALSQPLLDLGAMIQPSPNTQCWRRLVVIVDRAKSSAVDAAAEVVAFGPAGPERVLFDVWGPN